MNSEQQIEGDGKECELLSLGGCKRFCSHVPGIYPNFSLSYFVIKYNHSSLRIVTKARLNTSLGYKNRIILSFSQGRSHCVTAPQVGKI